MEENKLEASPSITPVLMEIKINSEIAKTNLTVPVLRERAINMPKDEDHLKEMKILLEDIDKVGNIASQICDEFTKPRAEDIKAAKEGKKLVFDALEIIRGMVEPDYDSILDRVDKKKQEAAKKEAQDLAIKKGIEETAMTFAKLIATASTGKELADIERLINLEKSPSRSKKYGDFHEQATKKYDEMLIPLIKSQKKRVVHLSTLHGKLKEADSNEETEIADQLKGTIEEVSGDVRKVQAVAEDLLLNQDFFPIVVAEEVLPDIRVKRTDISYELIDQAVALKKALHLLTIELNKKELKKVAAKMKADGEFEGKDEVIVDGIKYIVTRLREAL